MMRNMRLRGIFAALALVSAALCVPGSAQAGPITNYTSNYPGAIRVMTRAWVGPGRFLPPQQIYSSPNLILSDLNSAWNQYQWVIANNLKTALGKKGAAISGQTLYNITIRLANSGSLTAWQEGDGLGLQYLLPANYIEATSTQPLPGSWEDPTFSVTFDIYLTAHLTIPADLSPVSVTSATGQVQNANLQPHGVAAEVAFIVNDLSSFFGGPNFVAAVVNEINHEKVNLTTLANASLGAINTPLAQARAKGDRNISPALDPNAKLLTLTLTQGNPLAIGPGVTTRLAPVH